MTFARRARLALMPASHQSSRLVEQPHAEAAPSSHLANVFSASDCFVSAPERETLGLSLLEAASMKLRLIAALAGGVMDVLIDGKTALLADKRSLDSLATCMLKLRDNPILQKVLGHNARRFFEQ